MAVEAGLCSVLSDPRWRPRRSCSLTTFKGLPQAEAGAGGLPPTAGAGSSWALGASLAVRRPPPAQARGLGGMEN